MEGTLKILGAHIHGEGKPEIIKTEHKALCSKEGLTYIITYSDTDTGSDNSSGNIEHKLIIGEGFLRMSQTGDITSDLHFKLGEIWNTDYQTPYGLMKMTAITRHLMLEFGPKKISAHVQYELQMDGEKVSDSKVRISFIPD
ncbi:DUF1934 domain-containing protein [Butyrivibrio sp. JL13D10]|uniref:DUF1934 domain-containing protein n=1 Tax=Butyrivibrio sp. JL13D10 TaxID=3236815 RepID=UPI0038B48F19